MQNPTGIIVLRLLEIIRDAYAPVISAEWKLENAGLSY